MDKLIKNNNYRQGKIIDIVEYLDALEQEYRIKLGATCEAFNNYEDAYIEADTDYTEVRAEIRTLKLLLYINEDEYKALLQKAIDIKKEILDNYKKPRD